MCGIPATQTPVRKCPVDILADMVCHKSLEWVFRGRCNQKMTLKKRKSAD